MITPIRDEASHKAALAEIDRLWGSPAGTPDGDRLDVMMTLADAYERLHWPDEPIDPVDVTKARMENSVGREETSRKSSARRDEPLRF
jgi:HTH-type transcriptional regulator/antitoxin HigA